MQKPEPQPGTVAARLQARKNTHVSQRPTERLVDMKVLVLGLCRTGTASIRQALYELGYNDVYHMMSLHGKPNGEAEVWTRAFERMAAGKEPLSREEWDQLLGYCEAVTDVPPSMFAEDLIKLYPDAKVILTTRDSPEAWYKSTLDTIYYSRQKVIWMQTGIMSEVALRVLPLPPHARMLKRLFVILFGSDTSFQTGGEKVYIEHNERVLRAKGPENVLVFNVKEGWAPLCEFLGKDIPDVPFPRLNDSEQFRKRVEDMQKNRPSIVVPLLMQGLKVAGVVGVGVLLWRRYGR